MTTGSEDSEDPRIKQAREEFERMRQKLDRTMDMLARREAGEDINADPEIAPTDSFPKEFVRPPEPAAAPTPPPSGDGPIWQGSLVAKPRSEPDEPEKDEAPEATPAGGAARAPQPAPTPASKPSTVKAEKKPAAPLAAKPPAAKAGTPKPSPKLHVRRESDVSPSTDGDMVAQARGARAPITLAAAAIVLVGALALIFIPRGGPDGEEAAGTGGQEEALASPSPEGGAGEFSANGDVALAEEPAADAAPEAATPDEVPETAPRAEIPPRLDFAEREEDGDLPLGLEEIDRPAPDQPVVAAPAPLPRVSEDDVGGVPAPLSASEVTEPAELENAESEIEVASLAVAAPELGDATVEDDVAEDAASEDALAEDVAEDAAVDAIDIEEAVDEPVEDVAVVDTAPDDADESVDDVAPPEDVPVVDPATLPDINIDGDDNLARIARVRAAQTLLGQMGYDVGRPNGSPGPRTIAAANSFAEARGLSSWGFNNDFLEELREGTLEGFRPNGPAPVEEEVADVAEEAPPEVEEAPADVAFAAGMSEEDLVREAQRLLNVMDYDAGNVDGRPGPSTRAAAERFAAAAGDGFDDFTPAFAASLRAAAETGHRSGGPLSRSSLVPINRIRESQALLGEMGYDPGEPDGSVGARTLNAATAFATDRGIGDVQLDSEFLAQLREANLDGHRAQ